MTEPKLVLIPSAYKAGTLYSPIPSNGDGDFTFSRTTAATRVNKDGFIEATGESLSSELVTNGGFYIDTDWTKQNGSTISGGVATIIANGAITSTAANRAVQQDNVFVAGKTYEITFIARQTVGSGKLQIGNGFSSLVQKDLTSEFNTYSFRVVAGAVNSADHIISVGGLTVSDEFEVKDISVKEVLIETNIPRIDYSDSSCPSLLLEPTRSNSQVYSEEFDNSLWIKQRASITPNDAISPSGLLNADKLMGTSGASSYVYDGVSVVSGSVYTISVFVKYIDISQFSIVNFTQSGKANFNIENGTVTSNSATLTEPKIENYGNGWYRFSVKFTATANASVNYGFILDNAIDKSVHIWGAQFELGNFSTSYIPTTTSAATRNQDFCIGAGNAALFNDNEGVLYAELNLFELTSSINTYISIDDGSDASFDNTIAFQYRTNGSLRCYFGGLATSNLLFLGDGTFDFTKNHKIAIRYKSGEMAVYLNGISQSLYGNFVYTSLLGLSRLSFGTNNTSFVFQGKCKDLRYYDTALTDAELIELTTL